MDIFESWIVNNTISRFGFVTETEPENTLGAYKNAIEHKTPILISVQSLDDGNLICFSYKNIAQLTKQKGYVKTLKIEDVENLQVKKSDYKVLTLDEALKFIDGQVPVLINIINDGNVGKMESSVLKAIKEYSKDVAIMSCNPYVVEWFKTNAPEILRGIKSGNFADKFYGSIKSKKLMKLKFNKICEPDFIVYDAECLPNKFVKKYIYLPIIAYNVQNENAYLNVVKHCDNVVCDGFVPEI